MAGRTLSDPLRDSVAAHGADLGVVPRLWSGPMGEPCLGHTLQRALASWPGRNRELQQRAPRGQQ